MTVPSDRKEAWPEGVCQECTKDLESDGWCFECRAYRNPDDEDASSVLAGTEESQ